jgi:hypothetical protein
MSEDLISRKAAIDAIWDGTNMDIYTREVKECLEALPSVTPLPCGDAISRQMGRMVSGILLFKVQNADSDK